MHRNQFGGTLGGPVRLPKYNGRDRTFFFFSYEGMRERSARTSSGTIVPTALERQGDFSQSRLGGGRMFTVADPAKVTQQNLSGSSLPQQHHSAEPIGSGRCTVRERRICRSLISHATRTATILSIPQDGDQGLFEIDQMIGENHRLSFRYFYDDFVN